MREALQRLVEDGLVNMIPNRGTFVNQVSLTELKLLMEARMELEGACARMVALSPEPKILVQLEQLVDNPGAFIPPDDHRDPAYALDEIFHPLFYAATGNPFIQTALLRLFYSATLSASVLRIPRFSCQAIQDDFHQILCAVRARDPDAAAEIMRRHIGTFRHRIAEQFLGPGTTRSLEGGESPG
jgi:DNA-binding GntR family transcriptional regulator